MYDATPCHYSYKTAVQEQYAAAHSIPDTRMYRVYLYIRHVYIPAELPASDHAASTLVLCWCWLPLTSAPSAVGAPSLSAFSSTCSEQALWHPVTYELSPRTPIPPGTGHRKCLLYEFYPFVASDLRYSSSWPQATGESPGPGSEFGSKLVH